MFGLNKEESPLEVPARKIDGILHITVEKRVDQYTSNCGPKEHVDYMVTTRHGDSPYSMVTIAMNHSDQPLGTEKDLVDYITEDIKNQREIYGMSDLGYDIRFVETLRVTSSREIALEETIALEDKVRDLLSK